MYTWSKYRGERLTENTLEMEFLHVAVGAVLFLFSLYMYFWFSHYASSKVKKKADEKINTKHANED